MELTLVRFKNISSWILRFWRVQIFEFGPQIKITRLQKWPWSILEKQENRLFMVIYGLILENEIYISKIWSRQNFWIYEKYVMMKYDSNGDSRFCVVLVWIFKNIYGDIAVISYLYYNDMIDVLKLFLHKNVLYKWCYPNSIIYIQW